MWKCKKCGSTHITCNAIVAINRFGKPDKYGIAEVESINLKGLKSTDIDDIYTDIYWCENCMNEKKDINELAYWEE